MIGMATWYRGCGELRVLGCALLASVLEDSKVTEVQSGPMFLLAILFGVGWLLRNELRPRTT